MPRTSKTSKIAAAGVHGEALEEAEKSQTSAAVEWFDWPTGEDELRLRPDVGTTFRPPTLGNECLCTLRGMLMEKGHYLEMRAGLFEYDKPPVELHVLNLVTMGDGKLAIIVRFEDYCYQGGEGRFMVVVPLPLKSGRPPQVKTQIHELYLGNAEIALLQKYSKAPDWKLPDLNSFVKKYFDDRGPREVVDMLQMPISSVIEELQATFTKHVDTYVSTNTKGQPNVTAKVRAEFKTMAQKTFDALNRLLEHKAITVADRFKEVAKVRTRDEYVAQRAAKLSSIARGRNATSEEAASKATTTLPQRPAPAHQGSSGVAAGITGIPDAQHMSLLEKLSLSKAAEMQARMRRPLRAPSAPPVAARPAASSRPPPPPLDASLRATVQAQPRCSPRKQAEAEAAAAAASLTDLQAARHLLSPPPPTSSLFPSKTARQVLGLGDPRAAEELATLAAADEEEVEQEEEEELEPDTFRRHIPVQKRAPTASPVQERAPRASRGGIDTTLVLDDRSKRPRLTVAEAAARDAATASAAPPPPQLASSFAPPNSLQGGQDAAAASSGNKSKNKSRIGMTYNTAKKRMDALATALHTSGSMPLTGLALSKLLSTPGAAVDVDDFDAGPTVESQTQGLEAQLEECKAENAKLREALLEIEKQLTLKNVEAAGLQREVERLHEESKLATARTEETLERGIMIGMRSGQNVNPK